MKRPRLTKIPHPEAEAIIQEAIGATPSSCDVTTGLEWCLWASCFMGEMKQHLSAAYTEIGRLRARIMCDQCGEPLSRECNCESIVQLHVTMGDTEDDTDPAA